MFYGLTIKSTAGRIFMKAAFFAFAILKFPKGLSILFILSSSIHSIYELHLVSPIGGDLTAGTSCRFRAASA